MYSLLTRHSLRALLTICAFSICSFVYSAACAADDPAAVASSPHIRATNKLPLSFEANRGQVDSRAKFVARGRGLGLFLTDQGAVMALTEPALHDDHHLPGAQLQRDAILPRTAQSLALRYRFAHANAHPQIEALDPLPGRSNYFIGSDPKRWRTDIAQYQRVRYRDVYPGVNVVYYGKDGQLEFDIESAPGADLAQVRLRVDGADSLTLDATGNLQLHTALGVVIQSRPVVYQMIAGERREVGGDYVLRDIRRDKSAHEVAFRVADFDPRYALVLDPTLVFATLIGGTGTDDGNGVAVDSSGNSYVTGITSSPVFPTTVGAYQTTPAGQDAFVTKISADGASLIYSTLIGGNSSDWAYGIGVDGSGNAYITGDTLSTNFPVVNALQPTKVAPDAAFITALNAAGNGLNYSTYLGGNSNSDGSTIGYSIKADAFGNAYVTGVTYSTTVPVSAGAFQMTNAGNGDAFVVKLGPSGAQVYGTYIGGSGTDEGRAIAVDDEGDVYVAGDTTSASFNGVTPAALGPLGGGDMLIAELNPAGSGLVYATKIGGSGFDDAIGIAVDGGHQVYFTAFSNSPDLPPATPPQSTKGFYNAYVGHLDDSGTVLEDFASYGSAVQNTYGVAIDLDEARQSLYVVGYADGGANTLPVLNPVTGLDCTNPNVFFACYAGGAFLLQYAINPSTLASATRVTAGNGTSTKFNAVAHDPVTGNVAAVGSSNGNPPTTVTPQREAGAASSSNPSPTVNAGGDDLFEAFVAYASSLTMPPILDKSFEPATQEKGQQVVVKLTLTNPNPETLIQNVTVSDFLPACLKVHELLRTGCADYGGLDSTNNSAKFHASLLSSTFPCEITFRAHVVGPPPCDNVTDAPTSNSGVGKPGKAHLKITFAPSSTWNAGGGRGTKTGASATPSPATTGSMGDGANWVGGTAPANGNDITFPSGAAQTSVINDLPAGQTFNLVNLSGTGYGLGGGTFNLLAGVINNGAGNTFSAQIQANLPAVFTSDPASATLNLPGGIDLNGNNAYFDGAGTSNVSGTISGAGDVYGDGPGDVIVSVVPGFTGNFNIVGGVLYARVSMSQPVNVFDFGTLRGTGPIGAVTVNDSGDVYPGTNSTPVTLSLASLTVNGGFVELAFAANNTSYSSLNALGAVQLNGGTLKLDLVTTPTLGTVFSNLITAPGTITGCFGQATDPLPNVFVKPQCSSNAVSAIVDAVDGVFRNGFGG